MTIDLMQQPIAEAQTFTVDVNAALGFVDVIATPTFGLLTARDGSKKFSEGDNFTILSIGIVLPLSFEIYENAGTDHLTPGIHFTAMQDGGAPQLELNPEGVVLPFGQYEMNLGVFQNAASLPWDFNLAFGIDKMRISMEGVPAALDGIKFHVPIFAKIEHTIALN